MALDAKGGFEAAPRQAPSFGLWRSAPGHGKLPDANWGSARGGLACEGGFPAQCFKSAPR